MLRVRINWTGLNQGFSIFHFLPGTEDETTAQAAADAAGAWCGGVDNGLVPAQLWAIDPEVLQVNVGTGQTEGVFAVTPPDGAGSSPGTAVPNASMVLTRWRTGVFTGGRELRGRTFLPGANIAGSDDDGNINSASLAVFNAAAATLISTSDFAIWGSTTAHAATVVSGTTWSEFAVLRSRRD